VSKIMLLAGFPRSGTTWFANLINAHPNVIYRHELIGRNHHLLGRELFSALKTNFGLSDSQHDKVLNFIADAHVDTDKPPFFKKNYKRLRYPRFHHYAWQVTKVCSPLNGIYKNLFSLDEMSDVNYLIKETRSLSNFDSMIAGLRASTILFLVRKPEGSIASHISGIKKGSMDNISEENKRRWFHSPEFQNSTVSHEYSEEKMVAMSNAEFLSINWLLYHEKIVDLYQKYPHAKICIYDEFVMNTHEHVARLFKQVGLDNSQNVTDFIDESSSVTVRPKNALQRDSSDTFYSVYREKGFDHDSWKTVLTDAEKTVNKHHTSIMYDQIRQLAQGKSN
jgi:hypothetical protein